MQHGRNRILKTSLHFGRFSRAVCHHPQIHAYILLGFERLRTQHRQHARHAHFFAIFAVGKTRLKNATFKSRRRSSRGTCTLYKRLRVSNHFHNLFLTSNENLTPTSYTFSEFLSANFRENSAIFTKNCIFFAPRKVLQTVFCYLFSHETFIFSGRKLGVWVYLIRACTTGSAGLASGFHTKSVIFKSWNESLVSQNVRCDWKMKCWEASFVAQFDSGCCFLPVAFGGSESIQFELAPRDRTPRRRQITRNMQFSKFKMRAAWIDRLHFNLQKLDSS